MVSLQALGTPYSIFLKAADPGLRSHFPAATLHGLTLHASPESPAPGLHSGCLGNPQSSSHPEPFPDRASGLSQSHVPALRHANTTGWHWCHQLGGFLYFEEITEVTLPHNSLQASGRSIFGWFARRCLSGGLDNRSPCQKQVRTGSSKRPAAAC